jgi:hypothetical protein
VLATWEYMAAKHSEESKAFRVFPSLDLHIVGLIYFRRPSFSAMARALS